MECSPEPVPATSKADPTPSPELEEDSPAIDRRQAPSTRSSAPRSREIDLVGRVTHWHTSITSSDGGDEFGTSSESDEG